MKKLTLLCLIALTHAHNSFGMLIKTSTRKLALHKPIKYFHTSKTAYIWTLQAMQHAKKAADISSENQNILKENNVLLQKIIQQNEKTHQLLLNIMQQNHLLSYRTFNNYAQQNVKITSALNQLYESLEKEHNIQIKKE